MQQIFTLFTLTCLLVTATLTAQEDSDSGAFIVETFNSYTAGDTLGGLNGGSGWAGPWMAMPSSDSSIIQGSGLSNTMLVAGTSGSSLRLFATGSTERSIRIFDTPLDTTDNADFWFSAHLGATGDPAGTVGNLILIDTTVGAFQQVIIGKQFGQRNIFAVGDGQVGGATQTGRQFAEEGASLIVGHMVRVAGRWELDLYVNPDVSAENLEEDAAQIINKAYTSGNFNGVALRIDGTGTGLRWDTDDIYFGSSYRDVVPNDLEQAEGPQTDAFAVETFNSYTAGDTLGGLDGGSGWSSPWVAAPASGSSLIRGSGLLNNNLAAGTSGNSLRITATGSLEQSNRYLESVIDTTGNDDFWFSAHLGASGTPGGAVGNLILLDTTDAAANQVIVGKPFPDFRVFAGGAGQRGGNTFSGRSFDGSGASFVVGHMTRDTGVWSLDLYVNPDVAAEDLVEDSAQIINKPYTSGNFNGIAVRIDGGSTELVWDVDDIYLGGSYRDVVPADLETVTEAPPGAAEPFSYELGASLIGQDGGRGWAGPWTLLTETGEGTIEEGGITSLPLLQATAGPKVRFNEYLRAVRPLEGTYGDNGRDFWLGWWFDVDDGGNNVAHIVLADTATYGADGPGGQLAQIGKLFGQATIGVVGGGNAAGSSAEEGHFLVAHIITDGTPTNDEIIVWIDPALDAMPSADTADITAGADLTNWNAIGFKFEGAEDQPTSVAFDNVILGFTFQEVVPGDLSDVDPPNTPRAAVEVFDYAPGQDLNGADGGSGWAGPWEAVSGTAVIAEGSVNSPRTCPVGNSASLMQSGSDSPALYRRDFLNPFGTDENSETFYASFVLNGVSKDIGNSALVSLVSGDNNVLSIGGTPGLSSLAVIRNDDRAPITSNREVVQGIKWFVVRLDINSLTGLATAYVFLDPISDAIPSDETALFVVENVSIVDGITGITVSGSGAQTVSLAVDDIRAGFSYRDISCQFGSDDPDLLAYEPFNYDPGTRLVGAGGENAFWNGPWTLGAANATNTAIVRDGSLDVGALDEEANRVELSLLAEGEQLRIDRELAFPIASDGRTYWLSFLMNTTNGAAANNVGNVVLRNSGISAADGQRILFGRLFGERTLGSAIPGGAARRTAVVDEGLHWIVVRMQTSPTADVDTVTLWIDPPAAATAPDTFSTGYQQYFTTPALLDGADVVRMRVEGVQGDQVPYITEFDELALTTSWSSVVGTVNSIQRQIDDPFGVRAYPNPFATALTIEYSLPVSGQVAVDLLNLNGQVVQQVREGVQPAGSQRITLDAATLPDGVYMLRIGQGGRHTTRKIVLLR
ncbi:T9SS type A sorting domain-containing protein [Neolewinella sp.]|uniref:T9SS type A sorting domain-containing protein n=1 Tax=Neolewinella sp. TaxID=2993543 RepID=UPI003B52CC4E